MAKRADDVEPAVKVPDYARMQDVDDESARVSNTCRLNFHVQGDSTGPGPGFG